MSVTNNVTRLLQSRKIVFTTHEFSAEKLGAQEVAALLGFEPSRVFKTIVAVRTGAGKPILAVMPGDRELNLKLAAKAVGEKKIKTASHADAEALTKLQTGGISPLALVNRGFQILIDRSALNFDTILVSGGQRGLNIELAPKDLIALVSAKVANLG